VLLIDTCKTQVCQVQQSINRYMASTPMPLMWPSDKQPVSSTDGGQAASNQSLQVIRISASATAWDSGPVGTQAVANLLKSDIQQATCRTCTRECIFLACIACCGHKTLMYRYMSCRLKQITASASHLLFLFVSLLHTYSWSQADVGQARTCTSPTSTVQQHQQQNQSQLQVLFSKKN
jgi:hypothetical protein